MTNITTPLEPILLRAKDASLFIGVSPRTLANLRATGRLPLPVKLGGCVLWKRADLELWTKLDCPNIDKFISLKKGI